MGKTVQIMGARKMLNTTEDKNKEKDWEQKKRIEMA